MLATGQLRGHTKESMHSGCEKDGEWQKASGVCVSVVVIVVLVVVVIVIIAVVVLLAMKTHKKKAVGGVKGRTVKTAAAKKTATKTVKV